MELHFFKGGTIIKKSTDKSPQYRIVSQEEEFLRDKTWCDIVYGHILSASLLSETEDFYYIRKSNCTASGIASALKLENEDIRIDARTVKKSIDCFLKIGLLTPSKIKLDGRYGVPIYIVKQEDYSRYTEISLGLLDYLVRAGNKSIIKIYSVLKNRYNTYNSNKSKYAKFQYFSFNELALALGYAPHTSINETFRAALLHLTAIGVIGLEDEYKVIGGVGVHYYKITKAYDDETFDTKRMLKEMMKNKVETNGAQCLLTKK